MWEVQHTRWSAWSSQSWRLSVCWIIPCPCPCAAHSATEPRAARVSGESLSSLMNRVRLPQWQHARFLPGTTCMATDLASWGGTWSETALKTLLRSGDWIWSHNLEVRKLILFQAFNPGDFRTYWAVEYSVDGCSARYPGVASMNMADEFCKRMGGRMPGVASDADISRRAGLRVFSLADLRNPGEKENFVRTGKSRDKCSYSLQIP